MHLPDPLFAPHHALADHLLNHLADLPTDAAHDQAHLLRVWENVRRIAAQEGGDLRVLTAASLLHDCVHVAKDSPDRARASRMSAACAAQILSRLDWFPDAIDQVVHAIEAHSFSANIPPETLEACILQDADRLDALGHIGIARCFAVSGALGRPLYDPDDPEGRSRPLDDSSYAIDHFSTKLLRLADGFQTGTGRRMAAERHSVLQRFLTGFFDEVAPDREPSPPPLR